MGIPQTAFKAITGDNREAARYIADLNKSESAGAYDLFAGAELDLSNVALGKHTDEITRSMPRRLADLTVQRRRLREVDAERRAAKRTADAWCAAFVQPKLEETAWSPITRGTLNWIGDGQAEPSRQQTAELVDALAGQYRFFHWHLEFPHIFAVRESGALDEPEEGPGWAGGFTCVIGNPPWERVKLQEKEFFAARHEAVATAKNASARKKLIASLETSGEEFERNLFADFQTELRAADGWSQLLRESGRYPLTGRGDINTYAVFAETGRTIVAGPGRVGMVLPTGIATDATTQHFFKQLVATETLASLYDFENEEKIFESVHHAFRFCLWTAGGRWARQERIRLAFRLRQVDQLQERRFTLTPADIELLNPNTGTCPVFDFKRNADITVGIYRRVPVLWREGDEDGNPWDLSFRAMFHMSNDSGLFHSREALEADGWVLEGNVFVRDKKRMLPLYEAKMLHHFDDRLGTYDGQTEAQAKMGTLPRSTAEQKDDPTFAVLPRYWVKAAEVEDRLSGEKRGKLWDKGWLLGWRDIARSSDDRTVISSALPRAAVGDKFLLALPPSSGACLQANLSSLILDFCARQKIAGTSLKYFLFKQLPILPPDVYDAPAPWHGGRPLGDWVCSRLLELAYTSYAMADFALDHGDDGAPFRWDEERRFWLRAELDAAYFHLYGVERDDVDYVMDTFRAFRNTAPERFARTKQAILDIYDELTTAITTGTPYQTRLDPPPGLGPRHQSAREITTED